DAGMPHLVATRHLRGLPSLDRGNIRRGLVAKVVLQPFQQGHGPEPGEIPPQTLPLASLQGLPTRASTSHSGCSGMLFHPK
ncbi:MAG: hypothetical protein ACJ8CN_10830, partial [Gemmatimonadales bacterium]